MTSTFPAISVAIVNDYPVIVEGLARLLSGDDRLAVVELDAMADPGQSVDIVLFDAFSQLQLEDSLRRLAGNPAYGQVVVYSWNVEPAQIQQALAAGVGGYLSKELDTQRLRDALVRVHGGEQVIEPEHLQGEPNQPGWPGKTFGLSARESEVITMITQGITNDEIARSSYLSINSVKSYIRSAYRKMGVERRSQAVLWGVENGMLPRRERREL